MSLLRNSDVNPYTSPWVTELVNPLFPVPIRKTRTIKWAITLLAFKVVGLFVGQWQAVNSQGLSEFRTYYLEHPLDLIVPVVTLVGLLTLIFGKRSLAAYWLGGLGLVAFTWDGALGLLYQWESYGSRIKGPETVSYATFSLLFLGALAFLAYRFFLGLPTRRYYRLAPPIHPEEA